MREIKFRAWDISKRKILRNVGFHPHICMIHEGYKTGDDAELTIAPDFTNYKIMQYTGLKDKNGVEIYDGDIVCAKLSDGTIDQTAVVVQERACSWGWGVYGTISLALIYHEDTEVIGNIHQNPKLLENDDE